MGQFLAQTFEEHSILWLVVSAILGGLLSRAIGFLFDVRWASQYKERRQRERSFREVTFPLLHVADSLEDRIQKSLNMVQAGHFLYSEHEDFRMDILYKFGTFFAWVHVVEQNAYVRFPVSRKAKEFKRLLYNMAKGLSSHSYFQSLELPVDETERASVPKFAIVAMGELLAVENDGAQHASILAFTEFAERMRTDERYATWFGYLDSLLVGLEEGSLEWDRLAVFAATLSVAIIRLGPTTHTTAPRETIRTDRIHRPEVREALLEDIARGGMTGYVAEL